MILLTPTHTRTHEAAVTTSGAGGKYVGRSEELGASPTQPGLGFRPCWRVYGGHRNLQPTGGNEFLPDGVDSMTL